MNRPREEAEVIMSSMISMLPPIDDAHDHVGSDSSTDYASSDSNEQKRMSEEKDIDGIDNPELGSKNVVSDISEYSDYSVNENINTVPFSKISDEHPQESDVKDGDYQDNKETSNDANPEEESGVESSKLSGYNPQSQLDRENMAEVSPLIMYHLSTGDEVHKDVKPESHQESIDISKDQGSKHPLDSLDSVESKKSAKSSKASEEESEGSFKSAKQSYASVGSSKPDKSSNTTAKSSNASRKSAKASNASINSTKSSSASEKSAKSTKSSKASKISSKEKVMSMNEETDTLSEETSHKSHRSRKSSAASTQSIDSDRSSMKSNTSKKSTESVKSAKSSVASKTSVEKSPLLFQNEDNKSANSSSVSRKSAKSSNASKKSNRSAKSSNASKQSIKEKIMSMDSASNTSESKKSVKSSKSKNNNDELEYSLNGSDEYFPPLKENPTPEEGLEPFPKLNINRVSLTHPQVFATNGLPRISAHDEEEFSRSDYDYSSNQSENPIIEERNIPQNSNNDNNSIDTYSEHKSVHSTKSNTSNKSNVSSEQTKEKSRENVDSFGNVRPLIDVPPPSDPEEERRNLTQRLAELKKGLEGSEELNRKVRSLKSNIHRRDESIDDMTTRLSDLTALADAQKMKIDTLDIDNERMEQRIKEATLELTAKENELAEVNAKKSELEANFSFLVDIEAAINTLKRDNANLAEGSAVTNTEASMERKRRIRAQRELIDLRHYIRDQKGAENEVKSAEEDLALIKDQVCSKQLLNRRLKAENDALKRALAQGVDASDVKKLIQETRMRRQISSGKKRAMQRNIDTKNAEIEDLKKQIQNLQTLYA